MRALALLGPRTHKRHLDQFRSGNAELRILESPEPDAVRGELESFRPDVLLVFGGDGTINRHLPALVDSGVPTLVVPTGSGNDLARANGTPTIQDAKRVWQAFLAGSAEIASIDLGTIQAEGCDSPRYFSCCANVGLDADATRRSDRFPNWLKSRGGYFIAGLMSLASYRPELIKVSAWASKSWPNRRGLSPSQTLPHMVAG